MQIANPIYDVVFKYMMEDAKVAKLLISSIISEEIEELKFRPQEFTTEIEKESIANKPGILTVYRIDFTASIKTKEGLKNVIIEIQKAKFATDIMRFRRHLGEQYANSDNTQTITINNAPRKSGIPVISIYFLGHQLDHTDAGVVGVKRCYTDLITGKPIKTKESFIESLTHDSYIIQIPKLTQKRRNELEILLSVFDQSSRVEPYHHILNIKEDDYPKKYSHLIRRLQKAVSDSEMKKRMDFEDGMLDDLKEMQRSIDTLEQKTKIISEEKDRITAEKDRITAEKERIAAEKDRVEEENVELKRRLAELDLA
ncbi:MAG: hypothetical protein WCK54_21300 [Desulfuromonadales bacterium]